MECRNCINLRLVDNEQHYACHALGWGLDKRTWYTKWYRPKTILENRPPVKRFGMKCPKV